MSGFRLAPGSVVERLDHRDGGRVAEVGAGLAELTPYMDLVYNSFGAKRLMWGSDWPVINLASTYDEWISMCDTFISKLPEDAQRAIWYETAQQFYGL